MCCLCLMLPPSPWGPFTLGNLDQLVNVCLDVLAEEAGAQGDLADEIFYDSEEETVMGGLEEYERTLRAEIRGDPAMGFDLKGFVKARLDDAVAAAGADAWREAEERCEPVLLKQLKETLQ